jgi:phosphatidylglycerophosphate synthase
MTVAPIADRRPIAARQTAWAAWVTTRLVRAGCSPNGISVAGMVFCLLAGAALAGTTRVGPVWERVLFAAAAVLIQLRLLANLFDGMVAIESGRASAVGELYNDVPDRISDAATLIGLGYASGGWPEMGYVTAVLAVLTAYVRAVGKAAGAGSDFRGPMAKQQRMFLATVASGYMAVAPAAWQPAWGPGARWGLAAAILVIIALGSAWTSVRRARGIAAKLRAIHGGKA